MTTRIPAPSEILRHRLPQLRREQNLSQEQLAELMRAHGWTWVRSTVAKVESGDRQASIDEFISLAVVLGVPPIALLTLPTRAPVQVTPTTMMTSENAWRWMTGDRTPGELVFGAIPPQEGSERVDEIVARVRRYDDAAPDFIVNAERKLPGLRRTSMVLSELQWIAGSAANMVGERAAKADETIGGVLDALGSTVDALRSIHEASRGASSSITKLTKEEAEE